jgi:L-rhamnose mutarotase
MGDIMERYAWRAKVKEGMLDEYIRRHDAIWPELSDLLKKAGIRNYTIWYNNGDLFGYYECEFGVDYAAKVQAKSPIVDKWNEYMKDVMIMEMDPVTKAQPLMRQVFYLE